MKPILDPKFKFFIRLLYGFTHQVYENSTGFLIFFHNFPTINFSIFILVSLGHSGPLHVSPASYQNGLVSKMNFVVCSYQKFQPSYPDEKWWHNHSAWNLMNKRGKNCCRIFSFCRFHKPQNLKKLSVFSSVFVLDIKVVLRHVKVVSDNFNFCSIKTAIISWQLTFTLGNCSEDDWQCIFENNHNDNNHPSWVKGHHGF